MIAQAESERNREFICPCGKGYFSYAALFTHVKQKHNGKPPGQIIKPKPEHKRGRPRKSEALSQGAHSEQPNMQARVNSQPTCLAPPNLNYKDKNIKLISAPTPFRFSSSSKFKSYRAEPPPEPTLVELPEGENGNQNAPEHSLLKDLTSDLVRVSPVKLQGECLKEVEAGRLLAEGSAGQLVQCLSNFINFCREGLRKDIADQIELLITVLLQHVYQRDSREDKVKTLKHIHLNDHIQSFFAQLQGYTQRWHLEQQPIFQGLNPMKILVVLYNWINSVYATSSEEKSLQPQSSNPSISGLSPSLDHSDSSELLLDGQKQEEIEEVSSI